MPDRRLTKSPAQLQHEIDAALSKRAPRGEARGQLSLGNQQLLFITFEPANTFSGVRAVPIPVDFRESDVGHVWTLYNETDKSKPPRLPFSPAHNHNAFIEDRLHDWNIVNGKFRYGSRVMDQDVWILVEMKNGGQRRGKKTA